MGDMTNSSTYLEQELAEKANELDVQHAMRERLKVDLELKRIEESVTSKQNEILTLMAGTKAWQQGVIEIVVNELQRVSNGDLWCPKFEEKLGSDQQVKVFTGSHWELIEQQQWKDFVKRCAERCGVQESQCVNHSFMLRLFTSTAFNLAVYRRQTIPDNEVWLNLSNGTLVFKDDGSINLRTHCKEDLFSYTLNYAFEPDAQCDGWHRFLDRVLPEAESQCVLAEFIGYCMMHDHRFEKMLWLFGGGLNGKSVTLDIIEALLGAINICYMSLSDISCDDVKRAGFEHKLLNISHESGRDVNANILKMLTSGERVTVKHLYHDPYETCDYGKLAAAFNDLPRAENTFGFFRRIIILPYSVTIPKEEIDRNLTDKLKSEVSGILNWVLEHMKDFLKRGDFTSSAECEKALDRYRLQSDSVRLFINEVCEETQATTKATEVYSSYQNYCLSSSLKPLSRQRFYERLDNIGFGRESYGNAVYYHIKVNLI